MFPKGDSAFKLALDASVIAMAKTEEAAKLYEKWFMQLIPTGMLARGSTSRAAQTCEK